MWLFDKVKELIYGSEEPEEVMQDSQTVSVAAEPGNQETKDHDPESKAEPESVPSAAPAPVKPAEEKPKPRCPQMDDVDKLCQKMSEDGMMYDCSPGGVHWLNPMLCSTETFNQWAVKPSLIPPPTSLFPNHTKRLTMAGMSPTVYMRMSDEACQKKSQFSYKLTGKILQAVRPDKFEMTGPTDIPLQWIHMVLWQWFTPEQHTNYAHNHDHSGTAGVMTNN